MKNTSRSSKLPDAKSKTDAGHKGKAEPVGEKKKHDSAGKPDTSRK